MAITQRFTRYGSRLTRRQWTAAIVLAVVAAAFIALDLSGSSLAGAHSGVRGSFGALYRGTDSVLGPARRWLQGLADAGTNQSRVDSLRRQNAALRGQLALASADKAEAAELSRLQAPSGKIPGSVPGSSVVAARVVAIGAGDGFDWTVTLDRGTDAHLAAGQTVTDGTALIGRVLHADKTSAVVLLAADPGSGVGARDSRSGEIGVATGAGANGFTFRPLNPAASLRVGDELVTGPAHDTSFVAGLAIGTVTSVRTSVDGSTTATVRANISPTTLDVVGVIVP